jgi:sugar phosphate isomerase/epimerase
MAHRSTQKKVSRRGVLKRAAVAGTAAVSASVAASTNSLAQTKVDTMQNPFTFSLNTSTIRGQKLGLAKEIDLVARAGYTAIEPWVGEINDYVKAGGNLKDLKKRLSDSGLAVVDAIGFVPWLMGDETVFQKSLESMKRDMEAVASIGGTRIAAPPMGATKLSSFDLKSAAQRYRRLLDLGDQTGVTPMLEIWGHSKALGTLAEAAFVTVAAKHPKACILTDVYHLYKGDSGFEGLHLIDGAALPVMHLNDYPADPPRETIADKDRIYPGDGIAPLTTILQTLKSTGAKTALSLELFNAQYWHQDAFEVLKTGLEKMRAAVAKVQ